MYRYQIQKGAEGRQFTNCRRISENVVESDEPLNSIYLQLIQEGKTEMTATASPDPQTNLPNQSQQNLPSQDQQESKETN